MLEKAQTYYGRRIAAQLDFACVLNAESGNKYEDVVSAAVECAYVGFVKNGAITKKTAEKTENILEELREASKAYTVLCVAHAHIDMNWMWGFDETVNVTLATFRTMLQLMREYPEFTFSQSQASVYKIVEQYAPAMLEEIRERIREGRWEVTAVNWVEPDKNMPNGEEQTRHILCTKKYLTDLLGLKDEDLTVDFEPDTFGHNANVPMILSKSGVKYLYHCRGNVAPALYYWRAKNGDKILVYREPTCYNWEIKPSDFRTVPAFARQYGIDKLLRVYGVGDHGGGATRKDLETILDMNTWPAMPAFKFGSYREFFASVEQADPALETLEGEQNFVFRGCYSTQSKVKAANRNNRAGFFKTEQLGALSRSVCKDVECVSLDESWQAHLFGHFHDIITGSGVEATRNYQVGKSQEVRARLSSARADYLLELAKNLNTAAYRGKTDLTRSVAMGAGAGFSPVCMANGAEGGNRLFLLYNYGGESGKKVVELTLWDFEGLTEFLSFTDADGNALEFEMLDVQPLHYWGHWYRRVLVSVDIPAYGYTVVAVKSDKNAMRPVEYPPIFERREDVPSYILENEYIRAEFDADTTALVSLTDKETGRVLSGEKLGRFRFIEEETTKGMSGWITGNYRQVHDLTQGAYMVERSLHKGALRQTFRAVAKFSSSSLEYTVTLDKGDRFLRFDCRCDLFERGRDIIPQLNYRLDLPQAKGYRYDIPYGILGREQQNGDVVANGFACADFDDGSLILTTDSKYSFRACKDGLSVVLLRASFEPDPYPETGMHTFSIGIGFASGSDASVIRAANSFEHSVENITLAPAAGKLPLKASLLSVEGDVVVSSVKPGEDGEGVVVRVYNPAAAPQRVKISLKGKKVTAYLCNGLEKDARRTEDKDGAFELAGFDVATVKLIQK